MLKAERAWLTFDMIETETITNLHMGSTVYERAVGFTFRWKNRGRTPAFTVKIWSDKKILPLSPEMSFLDDIPVFKKPYDAPVIEGGPVIAPGVQVHPATIYIFGEDFEALMERRAKVFVYSSLEYVDIFNPTVPRISQGCVCLTYSSETIAPHGGRMPVFDTHFIGHQNTAT